ncbi:MAG: hypothetical protein JWO19_1887 [Bryobacterales bacterium]|jgi:hypothetical protein|nr:hypothetical protein [Bryobacterales bacterium]
MTASALAILTVALSTPLVIPVQAQWLNHPTPGIPRTPDGKPNLAAPAPRAPDGKPDLSGLWNKISPKYSRNIAADLKPGEIQPGAEALVRKRKEDLGKDYMNVLCVPLGPGYSTDADSTGAEMMKIVQTPSLILILNPDLTYRQIFMDGRALETAPNPSWMGYSVGHWDGDTLVVESFGFNDRTWLDHDGHPHTEALRMTERYRRRDFGNLELDVTLSDPAVYTRPWTVSVRAELAADTELLEWVCNEKSSEVEHWIGKASDEKKSEVKVAPEILAKYVGTYEEQPRLWRLVPRVVEITVSGSTLFADMDGRGKTPLVAQSETSFSGLYGLGVEFLKGNGGPAELLVKHVSGDYRFERKK